MAELLDVITAFPATLKAAWVAWLVSGLVLVRWYRQGRKPATGAMPLRRPLPQRPPRQVPPTAPEPLPGTPRESVDHGQPSSPSAGNAPESAHPGVEAPASHVA